MGKKKNNVQVAKKLDYSTLLYSYSYSYSYSFSFSTLLYSTLLLSVDPCLQQSFVSPIPMIFETILTKLWKSQDEDEKNFVIIFQELNLLNVWQHMLISVVSLLWCVVGHSVVNIKFHKYLDDGLRNDKQCRPIIQLYGVSLTNTCLAVL